MHYRLGIDIGGTFTDFVLLNEHQETMVFGKTLTTYPDPTDGIIAGTQRLLEEHGVRAEEIRAIVHGTTLVTNAVIERKGARTGFITTEGFTDVPEIGRELRYDIYDIFLTMPEPLVPRTLRMGVRERVSAEGEVITPLSEESVERAVQRLVRRGVKSVAVCLLHSFMNPLHERTIAEIIRSRFPHLYISLSVDIMPEIREYERASATIMNAFVQPITDAYLEALEQRLKALGFRGTIEIMISSGRLTTIAGARRSPVHLLESGPAGGAMASVFFGKLTGRKDLLGFDMGGTTAKASLILNHKPEITNQFEAARVRRFKKGSGLPVRIPVIDLIEIGAGGGSIAHIDRLGLLKVGPESAASAPGPACYGRGGRQPTVTDADLVMGYLNEQYFLGGTMQLDVNAAREAIRHYVAEPLGISIEQAAMGIRRVVDENMASAARVHILEKGFDPRRFAMIAFGGAGPVHAFSVARLLGSPQMIIPVGAGVTSALGFLVSPIAGESIRSFVATLATMDWNALNVMLRAMEEEGMNFLRHAEADIRTAIITRIADMRYVGQGHEIAVQMPSGTLSAASIPAIESAFLQEYQLRYNRIVPDMPMETVTWRVAVSAAEPSIIPRHLARNGASAKGEAHNAPQYRMVWFEGDTTPVETPVFHRYSLLPGSAAFDGPAIIEEKESTTVIGKNARVQIDAMGNIVIDIGY